MNGNRFRGILLGIAWSISLGAFFLDARPEGTLLDGTNVDLFGDPTIETVVVLFVAVECPISNRFAPAVNRTYAEFESSAFAMWTVYTDDLFTTEEIAQHRTDYQYKMPALMDFDRKLAKYCGATVTPEAVVFIRDESEQFRMVYRGRVNNQYVDFGKWRPEATKQDLRDILESIRNGKSAELEFHATRAIGCCIGE